MLGYMLACRQQWRGQKSLNVSRKRKLVRKNKNDAQSAASENIRRNASSVKLPPRVARGTAGLAVAMGLGRFFYTPILPLMIASLGWTGQSSAWIATSNYAGYFVGSLAASRGWVPVSKKLYKSALVLTAVLLGAVAFSGSLWWQVVIRFLAGISSALVFVSVTQNIPVVKRRAHDGGIVYAGVGLGILVSGAIVLMGGSAISWQALWLICAGVSAALSLVAWNWPIHKASSGSSSNQRRNDRRQRSLFGPLGWLSAGYLFQGAGYIIIGTYLVVLAQPVFGQTAAASTWLLAGIATAPSPLLWSFVANRLGNFKALAACYTLQVAGAVVAVFISGPTLLFIAAALFGATFMGATMLTIEAGIKTGSPVAAASLTTWYSLGQIMGPAVVAIAFSDSIDLSFIAAAILLMAGMIFTLCGARFTVSRADRVQA